MRSSRTCVVRTFDASELADLGFSAEGPRVMSLAAWARGDHNSVDVAQERHESLLRRAGCFIPGSQVVNGSPVPEQDLHEGVYIHDRFLVAKVPSHPWPGCA